MEDPDRRGNAGEAVDVVGERTGPHSPVKLSGAIPPLAESFRPEHTNPPGGLEKYFQDNVIGGYGAFTVVAEGHEAFGRALTKKLIQEIAGFPRRRLAAAD